MEEIEGAVEALKKAVEEAKKAVEEAVNEWEAGGKTLKALRVGSNAIMALIKAEMEVEKMESIVERLRQWREAGGALKNLDG